MSEIEDFTRRVTAMEAAAATVTIAYQQSGATPEGGSVWAAAASDLASEIVQATRRQGTDLVKIAALGQLHERISIAQRQVAARSRRLRPKT
jgi:hypothetical protein